MKSRWLLVLAALLASASTLAEMSECESDCERDYKFCVTNGKMSQRACQVQLELCRKGCLKTDKAPG